MEMKVSLAITVAVSVTLMLAIIVITFVVTLSPTDGGKDYKQYIINNVNTNNIHEFLSFLTRETHPAGSEREKVLANEIATRWRAHGLHPVKVLEYKVLLASPDPEKPNKFYILDSENYEIFESSNTQPSLEDPPPAGQDQILSFSAFSGVGTAESKSVVYANYGSSDDFQYLEDQNIVVKDSIVIVRYGQVLPGDKVMLAEARGAKGVILYSDPADVAPLGANLTFPSTVFAPPGATRLDSLRFQGDLLTPGYPATEAAHRIPLDKADLPKIPVQPVGYGDASNLLRLMSGPEAPEEWQGGLDFPYRLGPGLDNGARVKLEVNNKFTTKTVQDVVGVLKGSLEPDRFVLLGNHYDAWTYGGVDPSSATATLTELTRIFGQMYKDQWRPRRTLVFCSWAAGHPGVIGSTEYAEQFSSTLRDRAVVYLNVETVMTGNYSFMAKGVPMLHDIIMELAPMVPNPDQEEVEKGHSSLYDTWLDRFPDNTTGVVRPKVEPIGSGSDYRAFMFTLGISSMDMCFTVAPGEQGLPLRHTAYETYTLNTRLMDRGLLYHQASARLWGLLALEFSTRPLLPLGVLPYATFISASWKEFLHSYETQLTSLNITTEYLNESVDALQDAAEEFTNNLDSEDLSDELTLRRYNDAMMLLDRSLLAPRGLPGRPTLNHVFLAPSSINGYLWDTFPSLRDLLRVAEPDVTQLNEQVSVLTHHFQMATSALTLTLW
nr:glutamate carboxypeptidase 2-like [Procambarus clarkii]